jgi:hypothetical protein
VSPDLAKAERALEFGDLAEASVHAWNALATIDPVEAGRLRRIAEQLGDDALLAELGRRDFGAARAEDESGFRWCNIAVPLVVLSLIMAAGVNEVLLSERERTRKLAGRGIGFLYYLRPQSSDSHSLVRSEMSGTDDIDALRERL